MKRRFTSMLIATPRRAGSALVALCLCLTCFAGSVFATDGQPAASTAQATSPTTGQAYPEGRGGAYRPVLLQMDNNEQARPQLGLSLADIVYEYVYWGPGHTRYLALYNDYHPELAGGVRSAHTLGMALRAGYDCPIVFQGGNASDSPASVYGYIETQQVPQAMLIDGAHETATTRGVLSYIDLRAEPHNVVADIRALAGDLWPTASGQPYLPRLPGLQFAPTPTKGTAAANEIIIPYDSQQSLARFTYNAAAGQYERWYNGAPHVDGLTGQRIVAANVLVLYVPTAYYENSAAQPLWDLANGGKMDLFVDGLQAQGRWMVDERGVFAYLDADGAQITLLPGKTFVQIVPEEMEIRVL